MTTTTHTTSIHKVRRRKLGCNGNERRKRVKRRDPRKVSIGRPDPSLSGVGGLVEFGRFCAEERVDRELRVFDPLKPDPRTRFRMGDVVRLLLDANVAGEARVFGVEHLAADPLFRHLAGGEVPSIDTVYRDLERFDDAALRHLEDLVAAQGLKTVSGLKELHVDIDTTVEPLFGSQEGALPGPNPRYRGRPSYHPLLAFVAETGTCVGAQLRHGDRGFGEDDVPTIRVWLRRLREAVGPECVVTVRVDAAGDCTALLDMLEKAGVRYVIKARWREELVGAMLAQPTWRTVDWDAEGKPLIQVATVGAARFAWSSMVMVPRVVAVRRRDRDTGRQIRLWEDVDYSVHAVLTNDWATAEEDLAREYDFRAEVEPAIAEMKYGWGMAKVASRCFRANTAVFLIKLLAHNLMRRFVAVVAPAIAKWRVPWIRRFLINIPARLLRSGRRWTLRLPPWQLE